VFDGLGNSSCHENRSGRVKYCEIIADNLSKAGWSWTCAQPWIPMVEQSSLLTRTRDDGKRFVVRADEELAAFVELQSAIQR